MAQQVDVLGYSGYTVDDSGNIYSFRSGSCRMLAQRNHKGYLHVSIKDNGSPTKMHKEPVHKLVLSSFRGARPEGMVCRHLNGNAHDNRLSNLCWGTPKENLADDIRHGTAACLRTGENAIAAKLSNDEVATIRKRYLEGETQTALANEFGVTQRHVSDIVNYQTRKCG